MNQKNFDSVFKGVRIMMLQIRVALFFIGLIANLTIAMLLLEFNHNVSLLTILFIGLFGVLLLHDGLELKRARKTRVDGVAT